MSRTDMPDIGIRPINDKGGYLEGWERVGLGIRPVEVQAAGLIERGVERLQFDFHRGYGDAPPDLALLKSFPEAPAVRCSAEYNDSGPLNHLSALKSFRDHVYNRSGVDWLQFSRVQDLELRDYHGRHHPDYQVFEDIRSLDVAYLPKKYAFVNDLPLGKASFLAVRNSALKSFRGFERLLALKVLKIVSCRGFDAMDLADEVPNLRQLTLAFCPKVETLEFVRHMPKLESLVMEKIGEIGSFESLRAHPSLKHIEAPPLKGAKIFKELLNTIPHLEFVSPALLEE